MIEDMDSNNFLVGCRLRAGYQAYLVGPTVPYGATNPACE